MFNVSVNSYPEKVFVDTYKKAEKKLKSKREVLVERKLNMRIQCIRLSLALLTIVLSSGCLTAINLVKQGESPGTFQTQTASYDSGAVSSASLKLYATSTPVLVPISFDGTYTEFRELNTIHLAITLDQNIDTDQITGSDFTANGYGAGNLALDLSTVEFKIEDAGGIGNQFTLVIFDTGGNPFPAGRYTVQMSENFSGLTGKLSISVLPGDFDQNLLVDGSDSTSYQDRYWNSPALEDLDLNLDEFVNPDDLGDFITLHGSNVG